ncbi:MAG TPA: carbamoyltransferase HypF [Gemmatimonadales bacterium]|nr:carbamoyltransferase HypF [Gemmatimonadales bacterium]
MTAIAPSPVSAAPTRSGLRLRVTGVVQGVGFRPFVHRLALRNGLSGWVRNASGEVRIEVEGPEDALGRFSEALRLEAPPLARIAAVTVERRPALGGSGFAILPSTEEPDRRQPVSPDVALCAQCEAELFDPSNRRYHYPFITCTDCGPRFTVIEAMPYDRERTSMRAFRQCEACRAEYETPGNRRHHSETNSCPECGPRVWLDHPALALRDGAIADPIASAARLLAAGSTIAIRGLGGFHLAVDATSEQAVRRLRDRKDREAKPFAVMVRTLAEARALAEVSAAEAALLESRERPIVLLARRPGGSLAPSVSPGLDTVGVMLAYTPLHHLLLALARRSLVMTSGNPGDEPIAIGNAEAERRLAPLADAFLLHDREIVSRYDDSVTRVAGGRTLFLRRARGYAPLPVPLPIASRVPLVAVGPHLKHTFALVHGRDAYVSQHIGDLESLETLEHFEATLALYRKLFRVEPEVAVRDLHPGYLSTRVAGDLGLARVIPVQHHHAHVAAVLAEHGVTRPALGLAFDGTGYGDDGCVWGCEFLVASLGDYRRVGHLAYAPLPGGDLAARSPWRAALGYLSLEPAAARPLVRAFRGVTERERGLAAQQIAGNVNAPLASSLGRLFDAAAAVIGVRARCEYEGQAAMELESLAGARAGEILPFPVVPASFGWKLDPLPLLCALGERAAGGAAERDLAAAFHESVAAAAASLAERVAEEEGLDTVALAGGCFQNARLSGSIRGRLERRGLSVLEALRLPSNDGAISYGQAAVAAALLDKEPHP